MEDLRAQQERQKEIPEFLEFCLAVAELLVEQGHINENADSDSETDWVPPSKHTPSRASATHLPRLADTANAACCRLQGCSKETKFFCTKCQLFSCITKKWNSFELAHTR